MGSLGTPPPSHRPSRNSGHVPWHRGMLILLSRGQCGGNREESSDFLAIKIPALPLSLTLVWPSEPRQYRQARQFGKGGRGQFAGLLGQQRAGSLSTPPPRAVSTSSSPPLPISALLSLRAARAPLLLSPTCPTSRAKGRRDSRRCHQPTACPWRIKVAREGGGPALTAGRRRAEHGPKRGARLRRRKLGAAWCPGCRGPALGAQCRGNRVCAVPVARTERGASGAGGAAGQGAERGQLPARLPGGVESLAALGSRATPGPSGRRAQQAQPKRGASAAPPRGEPRHADDDDLLHGAGRRGLTLPGAPALVGGGQCGERAPRPLLPWPGGRGLWRECPLALRGQRLHQFNGEEVKG